MSGSGDFLLQWFSFGLGALAVPMFCSTEPKDRALRIALAVWAVVWAGPPLVRLWLAMVLA